ncbi:hypothetical protein GT347_02365 [Xylophilus rhododendri]|uniref:Uncharacterized protein n=1 Tax=Xylophilus rhododendri TaxID=2697032 RepID=A0A857J1G6_9BURK|nr:hypothetical protein [Xylophilus rhododendri]QHI96932.1 hypothetical protein GT347_02365 [Xylophilus rhododendri]
MLSTAKATSGAPNPTGSLFNKPLDPIGTISPDLRSFGGLGPVAIEILELMRAKADAPQPLKHRPVPVLDQNRLPPQEIGWETAELLGMHSRSGVEDAGFDQPRAMPRAKRVATASKEDLETAARYSVQGFRHEVGLPDLSVPAPETPLSTQALRNGRDFAQQIKPLLNDFEAHIVRSQPASTFVRALEGWAEVSGYKMVASGFPFTQTPASILNMVRSEAAQMDAEADNPEEEGWRRSGFRGGMSSVFLHFHSKPSMSGVYSYPSNEDVMRYAPCGATVVLFGPVQNRANFGPKMVQPKPGQCHGNWFTHKAYMVGRRAKHVIDPIFSLDELQAAPFNFQGLLSPNVKGRNCGSGNVLTKEFQWWHLRKSAPECPPYESPHKKQRNQLKAAMRESLEKKHATRQFDDMFEMPPEMSQNSFQPRRPGF